MLRITRKWLFSRYGTHKVGAEDNAKARKVHLKAKSVL
jgi:hypothetical protein